MSAHDFYQLPEAWQGFLQACDSCRACDLGETRNQVVVFRGSLNAPLMIIGEGPGAEEDRQGKPFVGRSGQLLDRLLVAQEFGEEDFHICNIVKCRPPGNRVPSEEEAQACKKLLAAQFRLVKPKVIVLSGATALRYFTGMKEPISRVRGQWIESKGYFIMPTFHPAYVLRDPRRRVELWQDFARVREKLEDMGLIGPATCFDELESQQDQTDEFSELRAESAQTRASVGQVKEKSSLMGTSE